MLLFLDLPINLTFGNFFLTFKVYAEAIGYFVDRRGYNSAIRRLLNVYSSTGKHKFRFIALEKITESFRMCLFFFFIKKPCCQEVFCHFPTTDTFMAMLVKICRQFTSLDLLLKHFGLI